MEGGGTLLVLGDVDVEPRTWALPGDALLGIEATLPRLVALEVVDVTSEGDEVGLVEVELGERQATTTPIGRVQGAESFAATADGATVAIGGQHVVAGAMFADVNGATTWKQSFETGWPTSIAIDADWRREPSQSRGSPDPQ